MRKGHWLSVIRTVVFGVALTFLIPVGLRSAEGKPACDTCIGGCTCTCLGAGPNCFARTWSLWVTAPCQQCWSMPSSGNCADLNATAGVDGSGIPGQVGNKCTNSTDNPPASPYNSTVSCSAS
jgi:hypothetical protein